MASPVADTALDILVDLMNVKSTLDPTFHSVNLTEIEAKPLEWLIDGMIPRGKLTVLAGEPSVGTSVLALEMISRVSRGCRNLMGSTSVEEGFRSESDLKNSSLLIVDRDELATTVKPRLEVMGAALSLVEILTPSDFDVADRMTVDSNKMVDGKKDQAQTAKGARAKSKPKSGVNLDRPEFLNSSLDTRTLAEPVAHKPKALAESVAHNPAIQHRRSTKDLAWDRLDRDLSRLEAEITRLSSIGRQVGMIVVDPIDRYFTVLKRAADVAAITRRFSELAWKLGVAIVAVARLKRTGLNRGFVNGLHSPACEGLAAKAPSVWVVAKDRTNLDRRYLLPEKTNLCRRGPGYAFSLRNDRVEWEQTPVTMTVEEYLRPKKPRRVSELDRAQKWLTQQLSVGPIPAVTIFQEGAGCFFSKITLRRAFHALEGDSKKMGESGHWWWTLPGDESEADVLTGSRNRETIPSLHKIIRPKVATSDASSEPVHLAQGDQDAQHDQRCESGTGVVVNENREIEKESQISDFQSQSEERPRRRLVRVRLSDLPPYGLNCQGNQDDQGDQFLDAVYSEAGEVPDTQSGPCEERFSVARMTKPRRVDARQVLQKKLTRREARNLRKQQKQAANSFNR